MFDSKNVYEISFNVGGARVIPLKEFLHLYRRIIVIRVKKRTPDFEAKL